MFHVSTGKLVSQMNTFCGCGCGCPVGLPIDDEIRRLEDHKKFFRSRLKLS